MNKYFEGAAKKCLLCVFSVDEKLKHLTLTQSVEHYLVITIMGKMEIEPKIEANSNLIF